MLIAAVVLAGCGAKKQAVSDQPSEVSHQMSEVSRQMSEVSRQTSEVVVGVNPEMWSVNAFAELRSELAEAGIEVKSIDLIKPIWTEGRPAIPQDKLYPDAAEYAGETVESKLERMRKSLSLALPSREGTGRR